MQCIWLVVVLLFRVLLAEVASASVLVNRTSTRRNVPVVFARLDVVVKVLTVDRIPRPLLRRLVSAENLLPVVLTVRRRHCVVFVDAFLASLSRRPAHMLAQVTEQGTTVPDSRSRLVPHVAVFLADLRVTARSTLLVSFDALCRWTCRTRLLTVRIVLLRLRVVSIVPIVPVRLAIVRVTGALLASLLVALTSVRTRADELTSLDRRAAHDFMQRVTHDENVVPRVVAPLPTVPLLSPRL